MSEFDKIIGYEEEKEELFRLCDILKNPERYQELGVEAPRGLLISGEPGVGKTLMADCLAKESGRTIIKVRKDKAETEFIDAINKAFEDAKTAAPAIVFLDDIDKFANDDEIHCNSEEYVTVQSCIDECRGNDVFALATANETRNLPSSLLRAGRFEMGIHVNPPTYEDARMIFAHYLSKIKYVSDGIDVEEITRLLDGRSCAELESIVNEAGMFAGYAGKTAIDMDDMIKACLRIIFAAPDTCLAECSSGYVKEIAYHEAGHAVIGEILEPGSVNMISISSHKGDVKGITSYFRNRDYWMDKSFMETRVLSLLGGRAAMELVFGKLDVGAGSDVSRASDIVDRFIDAYAAVGFSNFSRCNSGPALENKKDALIAAELEKYYFKAKRILTENRGLLDAVAAALVEKKTLLRKDIAQIKASIEEKAA